MFPPLGSSSFLTTILVIATSLATLPKDSRQTAYSTEERLAVRQKPGCMCYYVAPEKEKSENSIALLSPQALTEEEGGSFIACSFGGHRCDHDGQMLNLNAVLQEKITFRSVDYADPGRFSYLDRSMSDRRGGRVHDIRSLEAVGLLESEQALNVKHDMCADWHWKSAFPLLTPDARATAERIVNVMEAETYLTLRVEEILFPSKCLMQAFLLIETGLRHFATAWVANEKSVLFFVLYDPSAQPLHRLRYECVPHPCIFPFQTKEQGRGTEVCHKVPDDQAENSLCGNLMGAVFGAPIEFQEQSLRQPGVPHVLVVLIQKLEALRISSAGLYSDSPMSLSLYTKMHLINTYPIDDLIRMRPDIFKDPGDLAVLILRYVELPPRRLIEGIDGCIPDTTVNLDLEYRQDATCLCFTDFRRSGNLVTVQGIIGDNISALGHLFRHFHRVWEALADQCSPEEVVRLFSLLSRTVCGQTEKEVVQVIFDFINDWPHLRQNIIEGLQDVLLAATLDP
ncbi:unnamed protein product [Dibothriocephalus latus]|uniref:Uncharacterized protein n=1 Tax=Dibothriocephalus latus TaxID=60516 RepID=A0A3P7MRS1_DIBLA|nr:unnamed protein product [Dibothriocephalus latus]